MLSGFGLRTYEFKIYTVTRFVNITALLNRDLLLVECEFGSLEFRFGVGSEALWTWDDRRLQIAHDSTTSVPV